MEDLRARFGRLLAAHRRRKGLTQEALGSAADISVDMIGRIENGGTGVSFPTIEKLAAALGIDPAELFTTEIPNSGLRPKRLTDITTKLAGMSEKDLDWIGSILDAIMRRPN